MKMDTVWQAKVADSAIRKRTLDVAGAHFSWALDFWEPNSDWAWLAWAWLAWASWVSLAIWAWTMTLVKSPIFLSLFCSKPVWVFFPVSFFLFFFLFFSWSGSCLSSFFHSQSKREKLELPAKRDAMASQWVQRQRETRRKLRARGSGHLAIEIDGGSWDGDRRDRSRGN